MFSSCRRVIVQLERHMADGWQDWLEDSLFIWVQKQKGKKNDSCLIYLLCFFFLDGEYQIDM